MHPNTPNNPNPNTLSLNERIERCRRGLFEFLYNPGFDTLAAYFDDVRILPEDALERMQTLVSVIAPRLDFRGNATRFQVDWQKTSEHMDLSQVTIARQAAIELGMTSATLPQHDNPSYALVLGAGRMGPFYRVSYAIDAFPNAGMYVYAGSNRPTSDAERQSARSYAPNPYEALTELDLGVRALVSNLDARVMAQGASYQTGGQLSRYARLEWVDRRDGRQLEAYAISTPLEMRDEHGQFRRATTYDALETFAEWAHLGTEPNTTVGIATAAIYGNAAQLHALRSFTLQRGIPFEVAAYDVSYSKSTWEPAQLLQEIGESINAAALLWNAISAQEADRWTL